MKRGLFQMLKRAFGHEPPLHAVDHQLAKRWIKQRLLVVFPELRNNPAALDRAYRALSLEVRGEEGDSEASYEVTLPTGREPEQ